MSEQLTSPLQPEVPTQPADELAAYAERFQNYVPESAVDAMATAEGAANVAKAIETEDGSYKYLGEEVASGIAQGYFDVTKKGVNTWRLNSGQRSAWEAVSKAAHPSELSVDKYARMKALKGDVMEPTVESFRKLKQEAAARLKLDAEIAEKQGRQVAKTREKAEDPRVVRAQEKAGRELLKAREEAFGRVVKFTSNPDSKFASGPELKQATGLDREAILKLGFNSFEDIKSAATTWKAEKDEAARVKAYHAANNAKADTWNAERNKHRQAKQTASERVEKLSYKMKLDNGGELGLKHRPGVAEKIQEDAVAQAEAEGLAVNHLKPSEGYKVPTNAAAEARQSEYAAMLKAFNREVLSVQANKTSDDVQPVGRHRAPEAAPGANVAENWGEVTLTDVSDQAVAVHAKGRFARARAGLKNLYEKAGVKVSNGMNKAMEYLTDEQKGRRRGIVAGVAGVGLVALAYGASRGFSFGEAAHPKNGGPNSDVLNALSGKSDKSGGANSEVVNALGGGQKAQPAHEAVQSVKLGHGQTIYGQERALHPQATEAQLHAYTQRALDMNHMNWEQARHLAEGEEVKLA